MSASFLLNALIDFCTVFLAAMSMPSSACTSPTFNEQMLPRYGATDYRANGFHGAANDSSANNLHSQVKAEVSASGHL